MRYRKIDTSKEDVWITSDLHFFHRNVIRFANRPFDSVESMTELLISEWNRKVKNNDTIFHLGDFSFKGYEETSEVMKRLNGNKVFILGNHDKTLRTQFVRGKFCITQITDYLETYVDGHKVCMSHFPMVCHNQAERGSIMLHGHTHGLYQGLGRTVDVGYDKWKGIINIKDAIDFCKDRHIFAPTR